jgi:hypothetical protein
LKNNNKTIDNIPNDTPSTTEKTQIEYGGPKGPEPTRYGDWEKGGRVSDF